MWNSQISIEKNYSFTININENYITLDLLILIRVIMYLCTLSDDYKLQFHHFFKHLMILMNFKI